MLGSRAIISIYLAHFDATSPKERKNPYLSHFDATSPNLRKKPKSVLNDKHSSYSHFAIATIPATSIHPLSIAPTNYFFYAS
jgi:hypothetical protein